MVNQARDRESSCLTGHLAESRAQQAAIHEVATAYYRQLQEDIMAMCNGGDHALRDSQGLIKDQRRVIGGLRNILWQQLVSWTLNPVSLLRLSPTSTLRF